MPHPRMKIAEMEAARDSGSLVAVAVGWKPSDGLVLDARPATIDGVRQQRRVHSGARHDMYGHAASDGVLVTYTDGRTLGSVIVGPSDVLMPWSEYAPKRDKLREDAATREAEIARQKDACNRAAAVIGGVVRPSYGGRRRDRVAGYSVVLPADFALELAKRELVRRSGESV